MQLTQYLAVYLACVVTASLREQNIKALFSAPIDPQQITDCQGLAFYWQVYPRCHPEPCIQPGDA